MGKFLNAKWKEAEINISATDDDKNEVLQQLSNKNGIVVMKGDYSHTTLWSGKNFVDVENLGEHYNFYFFMGTATLEFWELK